MPQGLCHGGLTYNKADGGAADATRDRSCIYLTTWSSVPGLGAAMAATELSPHLCAMAAAVTLQLPVGTPSLLFLFW